MICILGGTFDPVHFGHLRPALDVQQALEIPCVQLVPCRVPPHRDPPQGSPEQRLELLRLAVADEPALDIDTRELGREGPSYMVETLESLRAEKAEESLCLALGMDALLGLESWYRWRKIAKLCHLVVMQRPGKQWPKQGALAHLVSKAHTDALSQLHDRPAGCVFGVPVTQMAVSSTQIRELLAAGKSPRYLMPDAVLKRIKQERWYAS
ncbi:MAG: nicotinate-nucleotide adenylyltransferase [Pseudomonadota bacterium]|nr:nicotinate-nucleotide adenylyltransferase [Pseudomonadota bacterium]